MQMWFASNCEAFGEGPLCIANLGGLKKCHDWKELLQAARGAKS